MATTGLGPILVPLDGSPSADAALHAALRLAGPGGEILIVHAINRAAIVAECVTPYGGDPTPALEALERDERDIFARAAAEAHAAGVRCTTLAMDGKPSSCIVAAARENPVHSIVMGTRGRRGVARIFLGSTAAGVLHETPVPTVVVHARSDPAGVPMRTMLVGIDESPAASAAAGVAAMMVAREGGLIVLAHVVESSENEGPALRALDEARANAAASGVAVDSVILHEDPVDAILAAAETAHADAIALGAHARAGVRFGMGSVAESIVNRSEIPVLVVPPPNVRTQPPPSTQAQTVS